MSQYTHLSISDRRRFCTFLEMGLSIDDTAQKLGKHRSTLYRERNRNSEPEGCLPSNAQLKMKERAKQKRPSKLQNDGVLRDYVVRSLQKGWSPETIYQFVYQSKNKGLYQCLPYRKPRKQQRYNRRKSTCRYGEIRLITQRPEGIATRKRFGHWEGDTIAFKGTKEKVVTTIVERKTRMVYLIKNNSKHSRGVMEKITGKFKVLPKKMLKTITFDQGSEFADYRCLEREIQCKVYYCEAHSPWQKGGNENMNGRLRRYLPRETKIAKITQEDLDRLANRMKLCPLKCLGYKTPRELFIRQYKNDCRTWL